MLILHGSLHVLAAHAAKRAEREQYAQFNPAHSLKASWLAEISNLGCAS